MVNGWWLDKKGKGIDNEGLNRFLKLPAVQEK
jgi:hypothetical protein